MSARDEIARALHRADLEPRRFDPHWIVHEWPELTDEAREYWRRLADALMPIVRKAVKEAVGIFHDSSLRLADLQRAGLDNADDIVRRVCGE